MNEFYYKLIKYWFTNEQREQRACVFCHYYRNILYLDI